MLQTRVVMKNVSRNKFLLCFKPVVDMDHLVLDHHSKSVGVLDLDHSHNQALKHLTAMDQKKEDMKRLVSNSSLLSTDNNRYYCCSSSSSDQNSLILHSPKKNFSRVIKTVFFETILSKKVRDGKGLCQEYSNGSKRSSSSSSSLMRKSLGTSDHDHKNNLVTKEVINLHHRDHEVNSLTSFSSSVIGSPSSSPSSRSSSISEPRKSSRIKNTRNPNRELEFKAKNVSNSAGIYLLLISLTVTIFWGKLCAILFTSICLYFIPRARQVNSTCSRQHENVTKSSWLPEKEESRGYYKKKKVIMEGLLERSHQRVSGIKFLT